MLAVAAGPPGAAEEGSAAGRRLYADQCAGCHAAGGEGGREGGVNVPAIDAVTLARPRVIPPGRRAYDDASLAQAITSGVDPGGRVLSPPMPRFSFSPGELAALTGYLAIIGSAQDKEPGVETTAIRIGAILPVTGPNQDCGRTVRDAIEAAFAAAGPVFGRTLHLVVADAGQDVATGYAQVTRDDRIFALVATLLPDGTVDLPVIGPLDSAVTAGPATFSIQATPDDQFRVLIGALGQEKPRLRLAVTGTERAGFVAEAVRRAGGSLVDASQADALLVLPGQFAAAGLRRIPDTTLIAARAADWWPGMIPASRLRLVTPVASSGGATLGTAAAEILAEGLKRAGAGLTRARLVSALETLREYPVEGLPPQTFTRGRHVGTRASLVIAPGEAGVQRWREPAE